MELKAYLKDHILLFDGSMGTYYAARNRASHRECEWANLAAPEEVEAIHTAYLKAGCRALKTNTFSVNRLNFSEEDCAELIRAGWEIAARSAGEKAFVFADIGPIDAHGGRDVLPEYRFIADTFLTLGTRNFLFETNSSDQDLHETAAYIRSSAPEAFIIVSFASLPNGFTRIGRPVSELLADTASDPNIDAAGLNCVSGAAHMAALLRRNGPIPGLLSAMPNAGYPTVRGNRTYYEGEPRYFAEQLTELRDLGAGILGGCCGTTPEHIAAAARALRTAAEKPAKARTIQIPVSAGSRQTNESYPPNPFWDALCDPQAKPFAVEYDPPEGADTEKFLSGARELRESGAEIITIADCPVARPRMDSSLLACKLQRETNISALPHLTCRDRNLNAIQALLLGLCAEEVKNILLITGDPIPTAERDEVRSVYNFNSRKLIQFADRLGASVLPHPFRIFAALNVNANNFSLQLDLAREKEANGAHGFFTQPVLTKRALENLERARQTLKGKLLGGIIPIVSQRNALFMNSEIAGITVDEKIVEAYADADRERGEELAVEISTVVAGRIAPFVDGYYLITPFGRTALVSRIMAHIRNEGLTEHTDIF